MKGDVIKKIITQKVTELSEAGRCIGKDFDKDTIHDFRIAAKTLRSFLRLLRMQTHEPKLKLTEEFKRLYHIAGFLRDAQLALEKISGKQPALPKYAAHLHNIIARQKLKWTKYYSNDVFTKLASTLLDLTHEDIHLPVLTGFFKLKMEYLRELRNTKSPTDIQLHNGRKQIKDTLYVSKLVKKNWKGAHDEIRQLPLDALNDLADLMGNYNDERLALRRLKAFPLKGLGADEKNAIKTICRQTALILAEEKIKIMGVIKKISEKSTK